MRDAASVVVTCGSCGSRLRLPMTEGSGVGKCPRCGVRVQMSLPPRPAARVDILSIAEPTAAPPLPAAPAPAARPVEAHAAPAAAPRRATISPPPSPPHSVLSPQQSVLARSSASHSVLSPQSSVLPSSSPPPAPGTFLFFSADATAPQVRTVPASASRAEPMRGARTFRVAGVAIAALLVGAAACVAAERLGGGELWVVKRSAVAWLVGMMTAAALMVADPRRISSLRLLSAATASSAVISVRLLIIPAPLGAIDALLMALAFAGSTAAFILAEDRLKPDPAKTSV